MPTVCFEGAEYPLREDESVLSALVRAGNNLPFSCQKGSCQICLMQRVSGDPGPAATKGLRQAVVDAGMFLPCCSHPAEDLEVARPDLSALYVRAQLAVKQWLSSSICELSFELETQIEWRVGQFVNLRRADGLVRSYSIASIHEEDYFLSVHVKRIEGGQMSPWLLDDFGVGDWIDVQGPIGTCVYEPGDPDRDILLLGTGSGLSPLMGLCRDALRQGHRGRIVLYHGSSYADGLYRRDELRALAQQHDNLSVVWALTREPGGADVERGRIVDLAFADAPDLEGWMVYLCGLPEMVHEARRQAVLHGVDRADIRADPFEYAIAYQPDDAAKIARIDPEPELWKALEEGPGLRRILTAFYDAVYEDPRLAPFFHSVTKDRAIGQQYAFLSDLFRGTKAFFGLRPFNAHHWMVISDELFDYRERLLESFMREHGLPPKLIRRWAAVHEAFRREIVKSSARGLIIDGVERPLEPPSDVTLELDSICDGCHAEMHEGGRARYIPRTGSLYCGDCSGSLPALTAPR